MNVNRIMINSTIRKSQIVDAGKNWLIKGIPVTVDNAEMNGIQYPADENAKGMPTINQKLITGGHPIRDGYPISVNEDITEWSIGGQVINQYNAKGVNYVDVKASKQMMRNADNKLGAYFADKLDKQESFGVSTGLNLVPVKNDDGKVLATNQQYDHLAFLHDNESPAGGSDTVVQFNADSGVFIVNIDDMLIEEENPDTEQEKRLINKIMNAVNAFFGDKEKTRYNNDEQINKPTEGEQMSDNAELLQAINALQDQIKAQGTQIESVVASNAEMAGKMSAMEAEAEKKKKAKLEAESAEKKAFANKLGLDEAEAVEMSVNTLRKLAGEKAPIAANAAGGFQNNSATEDEVF